MNRLDKGSALVLGWAIATVCLLVGAYLSTFLQFPLGYLFYGLGLWQSPPEWRIPHIAFFLRKIVFEYEIIIYMILGVVAGSVICLFHPDYGTKSSSNYQRVLWITIFTLLGVLFLISVFIDVLTSYELSAKKVIASLLYSSVIDFTLLSVSLWSASWLYPKAYELAMRYFD
ncbi:MAG: hypothetical protein SNJ72_10980 [Fimbriimonadales bacterium]